VIEDAAQHWLAEWTMRQADGFTYLDFLTAVDRATHVDVVAHALNLDTGRRILARTVVVGDEPSALDPLLTVESAQAGLGGSAAPEEAEQ